MVILSEVWVRAALSMILCLFAVLFKNDVVKEKLVAGLYTYKGEYGWFVPASHIFYGKPG